ncbi:phosphotransferase family protein [Halioxenophilus aromaticivorans]|uniref:Aminoglycoside phosphotransferase domain-containing protein n=1 Tax=Halioxenophilus aromaticivorans TaxID=1306992 RepID=A0AAV3U6F2_9ALTE
MHTQNLPLEEQKIVKCIETLLHGTVTNVDRQVRWRRSWFVDVDTAEGEIKLYVRGDRESDVVPFPELKREADIITALYNQGIPVPKIYGMCEDPVAIIMQAVPGTRDVSQATTDEQRSSIAHQYIDAMAAVHKLPLESFASIGLDIPQGAEAVALAGLNAYMPLYLKSKSAPDPLIEFAIRWLKNNIPKHRYSPSFVAFDAGQFLFENGKVTALYDFEFAMVGDPMVDIATMAMRDSYEPTGERISTLIAYYGEITGERVDTDIVRFHQIVFSTVACMQFAGALKNPKPGDPHDVYIEWDFALRRTLLNALARKLGIEYLSPAALSSQKSSRTALDTMLIDFQSQLSDETVDQRAVKRCLGRLLAYSAKLNIYQGELDQCAMEEAIPFVGKTRNAEELDEKLEQFVLQASASHDIALLRYFSDQLSRRILALGDIELGISANHIANDILD